jgi:phage gpG-like protein
MAFITVHVTNLKESSEKLTKLAMSMHNFAPAMVEIGKALEHYFSTDVFESEGGALGSRWKALSEPYGTVKRRTYDGRLILEKKGNLRKSFYSEADPMSVFISNNARTPRGANLFAIHQLGTGSGSGRGHNIPARPMMGINEPVKSIIAQIIETDLRSKIA